MWQALKIGGFTLAAVILIVAAYLGVLFYPGVLFAHQIEYNSFKVYSQQEFGQGIEGILDDIETALVTSEIYDASLQHDLFFGYGNRPFGIVQDIRLWLVSRAIPGLQPVLTYNASAPPRFNHVITFRIPDIGGNALRHPDETSSINMTQVLTHEVVHTFMLARLGIQRVARSPMWKQEGYADYVAASTTILADPNYTIGASVERILNHDLSWMQNETGGFTPMQRGCSQLDFIENEQGLGWPTCYYIARVLIEYLTDIKELSFDDLMSQSVTDTETLNELISAYRAGNLE